MSEFQKALEEFQERAPQRRVEGEDLPQWVVDQLFASERGETE